MNQMKLNGAILSCLLLWAPPVLANEAVLTGHVNLRAGPGVGHATLVTLPSGGIVQVHVCNHRQTWCHVTYGSFAGWTSARYLAPVVAPVHVHPPTVLVPAPVAPVGVVQLPGQPVVIHSHSARYPGRAVQYRQIVTEHALVPVYPAYPHHVPYAPAWLGTPTIDLR